MRNKKSWWKDDMDTLERIGPALKEARLHQKLTQKAVATVIRCSTSSICTLEQGKNGSLKLVDAFAWAVGIQLGDLQIGAPHMSSLQAARRRKSLGVSPQGAVAIDWAHKRRSAARRAA